MNNTEEITIPEVAERPEMHFVAPRDSRARTGAVMVIFPGGGYRQVCTEKEGLAVAREFVAEGVCSFVVNYRLAPFPTFSVRAGTVQRSLVDAQAAVAFVRSQCRRPADASGDVDGDGEDDVASPRRFGVLDAARIGLLGFSAGGHLSLIHI